MADQKISELTAVTTTANTDNIVLAKSNANNKITVANFFSAIATPASFSSKVSITGAETLTQPGAVSVATNISYITNATSAGTLTIAAGVEGQIKVIICTSNTGSNTLTLDDSDLAQDTIVFDAAGKTATLIYTNTKWYMIGGTATST